MRNCTKCGEAFTLTPTKPGLIGECFNCAKETTTKLVAKVAWSGKHTVEIEITDDVAGARAFNNAQRRSFHGPNCRFSNKENPMNPSGGRNDLTRPGAEYTSKLGEKHNVKR